MHVAKSHLICFWKDIPDVEVELELYNLQVMDVDNEEQAEELESHGEVRRNRLWQLHPDAADEQSLRQVWSQLGKTSTYSFHFAEDIFSGFGSGSGSGSCDQLRSGLVIDQLSRDLEMTM